MQGRQYVAPVSFWYLPPSHAEHSDWLSSVVIVPAEHGVGCVDPVPHDEPDGHAVHSPDAVSAVALPYLPVGQFVHWPSDVKPALVPYLPAEHSVQFDTFVKPVPLP